MRREIHYHSELYQTLLTSQTISFYPFFFYPWNLKKKVSLLPRCGGCTSGACRRLRFRSSAPRSRTYVSSIVREDVLCREDSDQCGENGKSYQKSPRKAFGRRVDDGQAHELAKENANCYEQLIEGSSWSAHGSGQARSQIHRNSDCIQPHSAIEGELLAEDVGRNSNGDAVEIDCRFISYSHCDDIFIDHMIFKKSRKDLLLLQKNMKRLTLDILRTPIITHQTDQCKKDRISSIAWLPPLQ